jgi:hypothetical protein
MVGPASPEWAIFSPLASAGRWRREILRPIQRRSAGSSGPLRRSSHRSKEKGPLGAGRGPFEDFGTQEWIGGAEPTALHLLGAQGRHLDKSASFGRFLAQSGTWPRSARSASAFAQRTGARSVLPHRQIAGPGRRDIAPHPGALSLSWRRRDTARLDGGDRRSVPFRTFSDRGGAAKQGHRQHRELAARSSPG